MNFYIGQRVKISGGSGTLSDETGTIVDKREVKTDNRGISIGTGAYKPVDWSKEVAIKLDNPGAYLEKQGISVVTMFKNRVIPINSSEFSGNIKFTPPYNVSIWEERDRVSIVVTDSNDNDVAEWFDDNARQMFEDGFFETGVRKEVLANSVIEYLKSIGRI